MNLHAFFRVLNVFIAKKIKCEKIVNVTYMKFKQKSEKYVASTQLSLLLFV